MWQSFHKRLRLIHYLCYDKGNEIVKITKLIFSQPVNIFPLGIRLPCFEFEKVSKCDMKWKVREKREKTSCVISCASLESIWLIHTEAILNARKRHYLILSFDSSFDLLYTFNNSCFLYCCILHKMRHHKTHYVKWNHKHLKFLSIMSFLILEINVVPCNRSKTLKKCQMQNRRQATDVKVLLKSLQLGYIIYNNSNFFYL